MQMVLCDWSEPSLQHYRWFRTQSSLSLDSQLWVYLTWPSTSARLPTAMCKTLLSLVCLVCEASLNSSTLPGPIPFKVLLISLFKFLFPGSFDQHRLTSHPTDLWDSCMYDLSLLWKRSSSTLAISGKSTELLRLSMTAPHLIFKVTQGWSCAPWNSNWFMVLYKFCSNQQVLEFSIGKLAAG